VTGCCPKHGRISSIPVQRRHHHQRRGRRYSRIVSLRPTQGSWRVRSRRAGANVRTFMHPAEMAKTAGSENPKGAAFISCLVFRTQRAASRATKIVWPEKRLPDTPVRLSKTQRTARGKTRVDFLCGEAWAAHLAKIGLTSPGRFAGFAGKTSLARLGLCAQSRP